MTEHDLVLPKFREYRCIMQADEAKHQLNEKYKQFKPEIIVGVFFISYIPYGHTAVFGVVRSGNPQQDYF